MNGAELGGHSPSRTWPNASSKRVTEKWREGGCEDWRGVPNVPIPVARGHSIGVGLPCGGLLIEDVMAWLSTQHHLKAVRQAVGLSSPACWLLELLLVSGVGVVFQACSDTPCTINH